MKTALYAMSLVNMVLLIWAWAAGVAVGTGHGDRMSHAGVAMAAAAMSLLTLLFWCMYTGVREKAVKRFIEGLDLPKDKYQDILE